MSRCKSACCCICLATGYTCPSVNVNVVDAQSTSLLRHVFRLLETALKDNRGIPWSSLKCGSHALFFTFC